MAMPPEFVVPARSADLESGANGTWKVSSRVDTSTNPVDLLLVAADAVSQEPMALANAEIFDLAYAGLKAFNTLPADAAAALVDLVTGAVQHAGKACKRAISSSAPDRELADCRSVLKAAVYLLVWLLQEAEKAHATRQEAANAVKAGKSAMAPKGAKGSKKTKAAAAARDESFDWGECREIALLRLHEVVELKLTELWCQRTPDETFLALFSKAAYTVLEQPGALKACGASLRDALWTLIAVPAVKYNLAESTTAEVVRLLLTCEHCAPPLAELMQRLLGEEEGAGAPEEEGVRLVADVLGELASLPANEMGEGAAAPKNIAVFLHALASRAPLMLVMNLPLLQPHLSAEPWSLRCGAVSAHGQLLIQVAASCPNPPTPISYPPPTPHLPPNPITHRPPSPMASLSLPVSRVLSRALR